MDRIFTLSGRRSALGFFVAVALVGAAAGCSRDEAAGPNGRTSIRLSPVAIGATGFDAAKAVDRDTTAPIAVSGPTTLTLDFGHGVEVRRVKVHGAASLRVECAGLSLGEPDEAGWAAGTLSTPIRAGSVVLTLTPTGTGARFDELEVWGAGRDVAPRDIGALAAHTSDLRAAAFENAWVQRPSPDSATLTPVGLAAGSPCLRARFPALVPHQARRAYLAFEANVPRGVALQHSFNGEAPLDGTWLGTTKDRPTLVDEVDPERLVGGDELLLCLPDDAASPVEVTGLRLLLLLDDGTNPFDRDTALRLGEAVDGREETAVAASGVTELRLDRELDLDDAELRLASVPARLLGVATRRGSVWTDQAGLDVAESPAALPVRGAADALRLTFDAAAAARVAEVSLQGSGVGARVGAPRIVVTYPRTALANGREVGERFGDTAYVSGWAESASGPATVEIEGASVGMDGAFSVPLRRAADAVGSWPVTIRARFQDGTELVRTIYLDDDREGELASPAGAGDLTEAQIYGQEDRTAYGSFDPAAGGKVMLGTEVSVEAPAGAVSATTSIGITRKGHEEIPPLDTGMVNVTAPANGAYRFLPRGQRFAKPAKVTLPYDPVLLPEGMNASEIRTWYFDEGEDRWITLPLSQVDSILKRVVSETDHFTFMINAVLVLPDHPGPASFNPNSIKDLKAADPFSGIDLVQPPEGNNQGSAQLSFPIRIPRARGAYQPELRLSYDSSGGNGWVGIGWDVGVSSIQVDTRWGVPDWIGTEQRYLVDGAQLVPTGEEGTCEGTTTPGVVYRERVARDFRRVVRCGGSAANRWFEVSDRGGTLFVYGFGEGARLRSPRSDMVVGQWFLERVVDPNGNLTEYDYDLDMPGGQDGALHREPFRQVYLRAIRYSGRTSRTGSGAVAGGASGPYVVDLYVQKTSGGAPATRADVGSSGRLGFKVVTRRLLDRIRVSLDPSPNPGSTIDTGATPIREYQLSYEVSASTLQKTRLTAVALYGFSAAGARNASDFYHHAFQYEDADLTRPFGDSTVDWSFADVPDDDQAGRSEEESESSSGGVGFGLFGISVGTSESSSKTQTWGQTALLDMNGDGLPDRVRLPGHMDPAAVAFNTGLATSDGQPAGGSLGALLPSWDPAANQSPGPIPYVLGYEYGQSKSKDWNVGVLIVKAKKGKASGWSVSPVFSADADGDGFPDVVSGNGVARATPRSASWPGFTFQPLGLPNDASAPLPDGVEDERRPSDVVLEWTAPFAGTVDVSGALSLVDRPRPLPDAAWDGVRLRVYRADEADGKFVTTLLHETTTDATKVSTPEQVALSVAVEAGTRLHFVLSTVGNFPVEFSTRSPLEETQFAPVIVYQGATTTQLTRLDPAGSPSHRFDSAADFRLAGGGPVAYSSPVAGTVHLDTSFVKLPAGDEIRICIQKFGANSPSLDRACAGDGFTLVGKRTLAASESRSETWVEDVEVGAREQLVFRVESDFAIDPAALGWRIAGAITRVCDNAGTCGTPKASAASKLAFLGDPYFPLHLAVDPDLSAASGYSARPASRALVPYVVPTTGTVEITTRQTSTWSPPAGTWIAARTRTGVLFKQRASDPAAVVKVSVTAGQEIYFEGHGADAAPFGWSPTVRYTGNDPLVVPINTTQDGAVDGDGHLWALRSAYGGGYHGWRRGVWHGSSSERFDPGTFLVLLPYVIEDRLDELSIKLDDPASIESRALAANSPMYPRQLGTTVGAGDGGLKPGVPAFVSQDRASFATATSLHASIEATISQGAGGMKGAPVAAGGGFIRSSKFDRKLYGLDIGFVGLNVSNGSSSQTVDALDMNGDRLIDSVSKVGRFTQVQLTDLHDTTARSSHWNQNDLLRGSKDVAGSVNIAARVGLPKVPADSAIAQAVVGTAGAGVGVSMGANVSSAKQELIDINGDGLPDRVRRAGNVFAVQLNLGGCFGEEDVIPVGSWSLGEIDDLEDLLGVATDDDLFTADQLRRTAAVTVQSSVGVSFIVSYSAAWESSIAATAVSLVDVTGDGLPDYVRKGPKDGQMYVMVNQGTTFGPRQAWYLPGWRSGVSVPKLSNEGIFGGAAGKLFDKAAGKFPMDALETNGSWSPEASESWGISASAQGEIVSVGFSYSSEESTRETGLQLGMMDIDGDGFADHVLKTEERDHASNENVSVRLNRLSKANLLKRVLRPLGGSIDLAYARAGHTVDMPEHRWVLDETIVRDGRGSAPGMDPAVGHDIRTKYAYSGGRYDRTEREFLGFGTVDRTNADGGHVVRTFRNDRLAFKGLNTKELVQDSARRVLVETVNEYADPYTDVSYRSQSNNPGCDARRPFMIGEGEFWCGSLFPALLTSRTYRYEGEAVARLQTRQTFLYDDFGNVSAFDDFGDVNALNPDDDVHAAVTYVADTLATRIHSVSRPKQIVVRDSKGTIIRMREGEYDLRGNLNRLVSHAAQGKSADALLTWDELGRLSTAEGPLVDSGRYKTSYTYDDVVGMFPVSTTDSHGYGSTAAWDYGFGETTKTTDVNGNVTKRVLDGYGRVVDVYGPYDTSAPTVHVEYVTTAAVPYAITRNRLPEGGTLDTVVLADGLGRAIQTKKTAQVHARGIGWSVSGHQLFDAMGRVATQGQPFFEYGSSAAYNPGQPIHPRFVQYDVLGRTTRTDDPIEKTQDHQDGRAVTTMAYGFGNAGTAITRLSATVVDPQGKIRVMYRDPGDRVVAVEERNAGEVATTRYHYDALGQLDAIADARGSQTKLTYDWLGQRLTLDNPDAGLTSFVYDAAGNLVAKTDARNLTANYFYDLDQLRRIEYADSPAVSFDYGAPGAVENGAGRVVKVVDDAGSETRGYGRLGELVRTTRTVRPLRPGDVEKLFVTKFEFDSFGRMQWILYPDGEKVAYGYDAGGLLKGATGVRPATKFEPAASETYLSSLTYDEQGQRRRMVLGNGVVTEYQYYAESRRLMALKTQAPGRLLQALGYRYDRVGNVMGMTNALPPPTGSESGAVNFEFGYDDLYRLTSATGTAESRRNKVDSFSATYAYDAVHNMTHNTQLHVLKTLGDPGEGKAFPPKTNHDFAYEYDPKHPHRAIRIGDTNLEYDAAGNTVTECRVKDGPASAGCGGNADHLRRLYWTEENRLTAVVDGGGRAVTRFIYDAAGDRVAKLGRGGESLTIGQFFSLKGRRAASKHVYAGATRLATKLVPSPGWIPQSIEVLSTAPGEPASGSILPGCLTSEYQPQKCPSLPGADPGIQGPLDTRVKPATYYYHPDHLGSTSWVTDQNGKVHEHVEYFPYGEVWRESAGDRDGAPVKGQRFLFTGKELDEETGLYYFGARYYEPSRARWLTPDPMALDIAVNRPVGLSVFSYVAWMPIGRTDPLGLEDRKAPNVKEWPYDQIGSAAWKLGWKEKTGSVVAPGIGDIVSLGGRLWELGQDPSLDETLVMHIEQYDKMAMTRAASFGLLAADAVAWARAAGAAALAKAAAAGGADDAVTAFRAVSRAEADDVARHGFRPDPAGRSMEDKWFSGSREGAEKFRTTMSGVDDVVEARVPRAVYDRSFKHPNIDGTGPGFCILCSDLPQVTPIVR